MISIFLDAIYFVGLVVGSPLWLYRMLRHGRYRSGWGQRLGSVPVRYGLQPVIWIHGVSLGEVNAARTLVAELHSQLPDFRIVSSSTTDTGFAAAQRLFQPDHVVFRWPLDFSLCVRRALSRMRPDLVVLIEGEVWPNFLAGCNKRQIPVVVVNARLGGDKGYPRYKKLGRLAGRLIFRRLAAVGVQNQLYAERFASLGTPPQKIHITGMMKFDTAKAGDNIEGADALALALGINQNHKLVVAGGTGPGEEKMILDIWPKLVERYPEARLAIVPRKPERFDEVFRLIVAAGQQALRRSQAQDEAPSANELSSGQIVLGDTMGELPKFYSLASCVFVGRSLVPMGGSDMIESAALGKATAFGPHTFNFPQADGLADNGCVRVDNILELTKCFEVWLQDPAIAEQAGRQAGDYVRLQRGATRRNVEMICHVLGRAPAVVPGSIATEQIQQQAANA